MSSAGALPAATFPVPPPLAKLPFIEKRGELYVLTTPAFSFLTELWAALQGSGGIIPSLLVVTIPAAGTVADGIAVMINGIGQAAAPDNMTMADGLALFGVSTSSGSVGATVNVQFSGIASNNAWAWTPGEPVWCDNGGVLTQTIPTGGGIWVRKIGLAISETDMQIALGEMVELT